MNRQFPLWLQASIFLVLIAGAGLLWVQRDYVADVATHMVSSKSVGPDSTRDKNGKKIPVVVSMVKVMPNSTTVEAIGTGRAKRHVMLIAEVPGEITAFPIKAGEQVSKNAVIARLESSKARLAVQIAQNKMREAERLAKRSEQLLQRNVNSQARVDDANTALDRAELEYNQAREVMADHVLRAPFKGIVGIPKVELGDRITANTEIVSLDDRSDLLVEFEFPELYISRIRVGHEIEALTPSFPGRTFKGVVEEIDSRIDPISRSINARAVISNDDDLLRPGMSFQVQIKLEGKALPAIPELALVWGQGRSFVWRVVDGIADKVPVKIVRRFNSLILVDSKLQENDLVVVEGVQRLRPGRAVSYTEPEPSPTSSLNQKEEKNGPKRL